jgi:hypothetical protein
VKLTLEQVNAVIESKWQEYKAKNPARLLTPNLTPEQILEMGFRVGMRVGLEFAAHDEKQELSTRMEKLKLELNKARADLMNAEWEYHIHNREFELLVKANYFDKDGKPRRGEEGQKIWDEVHRTLAIEAAQRFRSDVLLNLPLDTPKQ